MTVNEGRLSTPSLDGVGRHDPDSIALRAACGALSYRALDARSTALAARLHARGIGPGQLVGICIERSFDQIIAILAAWKAGAAFLPLDPAWPDARLRMIAEDARCDLLVGRDDVAQRLGVAVGSIVTSDGPDVGTIAFQPVWAGPEDPAYVIYTSGSTGTPKGVEISHANLAALIAWHVEAFRVTAADRGSHLAGLGFDAALWEVWPYLHAGASVSLIDDSARTSGALLRDWLIAQRTTIAFAPTALADELIAAQWPADAALRLLLTGADRLLTHPPAGLPFALVNNYGPTECTVVATSAIVPPGDGAESLPPIGRPIAGVEILLLDDQDVSVPSGMIGEIHIGGALVGRGYRGRPDLTTDRFISRGGTRFYRTGDLGSWLSDGQIAYHGRTDDQIKIRGHRIEPEEVAAILIRHPAVRAGTVAARQGADGEAYLVAYLVPGDGEAPTAEDIGAWLAERLPDYMVPGQFVRLNALPLTANGKVDRAALPVPCEANALAAAGFATPETPAQQRLAEILAEVLGRSSVGIDDNFFLLGGHSLLGTQVVLRASDAFGVELTLRHLFLAPTIRQLAALIEDMVVRMIEAMSDDEVALRVAE